MGPLISIKSLRWHQLLITFQSGGGAVDSVDGQTGAVVTNAVKTVPQTLTSTQQSQVQTNIGVKDTVQGLDNILSGNTIVPKASQAQYDTSGNSISERIGKIVNGDITVGSATNASMALNDGDGNDIVSTYSTKTELASKADGTQYAVNAINTSNGNSFTINLSSPSLAIPNSSLEITPAMGILPKKSSDGTYSSSSSLGDSLRWWNTVYAGTVYVRDFGAASYNQVASYKRPTADALGATAPIGTIRKQVDSDETGYLGYYIKTSANESDWDPIAGKDWIIESTRDNTSTTTKYCVKYSSGLMIQDYRIYIGTLASSNWSSWGSLQYYSHSAITWTTDFYTTPCVTVSVHSNNGAVMSGGCRPTATSSGVLMAISAIAKENTGMSIDVHVVGRWK